jgi:hypothetical protein
MTSATFGIFVGHVLLLAVLVLAIVRSFQVANDFRDDYKVEETGGPGCLRTIGALGLWLTATTGSISFAVLIWAELTGRNEAMMLTAIFNALLIVPYGISEFLYSID